MGSTPQHLQTATATNAADELEVLAATRRPDGTDEPDPEQAEENLPDPALAAIHVGRSVPVYRKLGEFNSKRVREIVHAVLSLLDDKAIEETLPAGSASPSKTDRPRQALREIHFPPPDVSMVDYELSKQPGASCA